MARVLIRSRNEKQKKKSGKSRVTRPAGNSGCVSKHNKNQMINKWNTEHMKGALEEYHAKGGNVSVRQLARAWMVPRSTLQQRIGGKVQGSSHMSGRKPLFSTEIENDLLRTIKLLAERGFPLGMKEVRKIAYSYAMSNGIPGFSGKKQAAGYEWLSGFLQRHPKLSIRKPEPLSVARAAGMNKVVVEKWFSSLSDHLDSIGIKNMPARLWNVDESGLQDHFVPNKVVAEVGKPCYQATSGEKGETTTIVAAFNAVGTYLKPFVIMKGKRMKPEWLDGQPPDVSITLRMSDNGWITKELFMQWAELFVAQLPKDDLPHVLFLDGHGSHVYNLDFLKLMKEHNVHVWCFPAHTTHWIQPADRSLFRSVKHHWTEEGLKTARQHAAMKLSKQEFLRVFATAWRKAATVENALSGFCSAGLFPFNSKQIPEDAYLPSKTTERALPSSDITVPCQLVDTQLSQLVCLSLLLIITETPF